jgi:uncharacterized Zn finger protein (UPF0148 family)
MPPQQGAVIRTSKACEECRKRKIRCNGGSPCAVCQRYSTACTYRSKARERRQSRLTTSNTAHEGQSTLPPLYSPPARPQNGDPGPSAREISLQDGHVIQPVDSENMHSSVSATHISSKSYELQLHYGSSSNFSLLQRIHQSFTPANNLFPDASQAHEEVHEGSAGIDRFGYRDLFFGTPEQIGRNENKPDSGIQFLSLELAHHFLDLFFETYFHLVPSWTRSKLDVYLQQLYLPTSAQNLMPLNRAILLASLAIGATGSEHLSWAESLYVEARSESQRLEEVVNLQSIHLALLLISLIPPSN